MPDSKVEVKACPFCTTTPEVYPIQEGRSIAVLYHQNNGCILSGFTFELGQWNIRPIANNGVSLDYVKKVVDDSTSNILDDCCLDNISSAIHAKLQTTSPRGGGELEVWCGCGDKVSKRNDGMYWCLGCNSGVGIKKEDRDV